MEPDRPSPKRGGESGWAKWHPGISRHGCCLPCETQCRWWMSRSRTLQSIRVFWFDAPKWISSSTPSTFHLLLILGSHFGDALPVRAPNLEQRAHDSPASSEAHAVQGEALPQCGGHPGQTVSVRHGGPGSGIFIGYLSKPKSGPSSSFAVVWHGRPTGFHWTWTASCCGSDHSSNDFRSAIWTIDYFAFCLVKRENLLSLLEPSRHETQAATSILHISVPVLKSSLEQCDDVFKISCWNWSHLKPLFFLKRTGSQVSCKLLLVMIAVKKSWRSEPYGCHHHTTYRPLLGCVLHLSTFPWMYVAPSAPAGDRMLRQVLSSVAHPVLG